MMTFDDTPGIMVLSRPNLLSPKAYVRQTGKRVFEVFSVEVSTYSHKGTNTI